MNSSPAVSEAQIKIYTKSYFHYNPLALFDDGTSFLVWILKMCINFAALLQDVDVDKPDEKSIMTYVAQFLKHYPNPHHSEADGQHDEVIVFVVFNLTMKILCCLSCYICAFKDC